MPVNYLHGVEVVQQTDAIRPVPLNPTATIGLIGTADNANPALFPLNTPVLLNSAPRLAAQLDTVGTGLGTLPQAVAQIYAEGGAAIVVVRVADDPLLANVMSNIIGSAALGTGVNCFTQARTLLGVTPKTLIAPGYTSQRPANTAVPGTFLANPVVGALLPIAQRLRARIYGDMPSTNYNDALAWRQDWSARQVIGFFPMGEVWSTIANGYIAAPLSASMAGQTARVHANNGFWYSSSNHALLGIGGSALPVDWQPSDMSSESNLLNQNGVNTIINTAAAGGAGWLRWGNDTCSTDPLWKFEAVGNCADAIYEALDMTYLWMVDKPFSPQLILDGEAMINRFLAYLVKLGALVGGQAWIDPELNTPANMQSGIWNWSFDLEPPAPMEHIIFNAWRNGDYYTQMVDRVAALAL